MIEPKIRFKADDGSDFPDWERMNMSDIFKDIIDKNHPEMPVLSILQGVGTVLRDESDRNILYDKSNLKGYKAMKKDDFIIHLRSFEGGLESSNHDGISSPAYKILRTDKLVPAAYRAYFRSHDFIERKLAVAVTGIRDGKNIDMPTFWEIPMDIPSLPEQQKIADFLSNVDDVIAASEEEVANLERQKKAVMQKIFSQEVRFKKEDGSDFPDWEEKKFGSIGKLQGGYAFLSDKFKSEGIPIVRISNIKDGQVVLDDVVYYECIDISESFMITNGDLLIAMSGATTGKCGTYKCDIISYMNQRVGKFVVNDKNVVYKYITHWTTSNEFYKQLMPKLVAGAQPNISSKDIEAFILPVPHKDEQQLIVDFLTSYDEAITAAKQELDKWKELKKGLLQQMFV